MSLIAGGFLPEPVGEQVEAHRATLATRLVGGVDALRVEYLDALSQPVEELAVLREPRRRLRDDEAREAYRTGRGVLQMQSTG